MADYGRISFIWWFCGLEWDVKSVFYGSDNGESVDLYGGITLLGRIGWVQEPENQISCAV